MNGNPLLIKKDGEVDIIENATNLTLMFSHFISIKSWNKD